MTTRFDDSPDRNSESSRIVLVGARGFGAHHRENIRALERDGTAHLVAIADPAVARDVTDGRDDGIPVFTTLADAMQEHAADVVIIATPIPTHAEICEQALRFGADVLLEKPPFPTLEEFERMLQVQRETGGAVQVGFQSLGSHALPDLERDRFMLGPITAVSAVGLWSRPRAYWTRSPWAGRRVLDGRPVVDGVATNPLAHAIAVALQAAGIRTVDDVEQVETELMRANPIQADDTSVVRVTGRNGLRVTAALTLCADARIDEDEGTWVEVHGRDRTARFLYRTDDVIVANAAGGETDPGRPGHGADPASTSIRHLERTDLLTDLIAHRRDGRQLRAPLENTGAYMRVVEAIRTADEPTLIDPRHVAWIGTGAEARPHVDSVESWCRQAASSGALFSELDTPWAHAEHDRILADLEIDRTTIAQYRDGAGTIPFSGPRPYLHPISTRGGVTVSAHHASDHDWHLGLGFAMPDAAGTNFWGGNTYVAGSGYCALSDHGRIHGPAPTLSPGCLSHDLVWTGAGGQDVLHQRLDLTWGSRGGEVASPDSATSPTTVNDGSGWELNISISLRTAEAGAVELASPGSRGRSGAGYGGLFWRLPDCRDVTVFTADAEGEDAVNGSTSRWAAWSATFLAGPGENGPATLVLSAPPGCTPTWFVRVKEYPGFGPALAWDTPCVIEPGLPLRHRYRALLIDGILTRDEVASLMETEGT